MSLESAIEWTDATWNPVTGCTKVSPGCKYCYAERLAKRLQLMGKERYANGFALTLHEEAISLPKRWLKPRRIFVNSMSDLFHPDVPDEFIRRVFDTMVEADQHIYQVLTKRPERVAGISSKLPWPSNVWIGTSIESAKYVSRADLLRKVPGKVRFLSCEPLLGPLDNLSLVDIHWLIAGGESGPINRPPNPDWIRQLRDMCLEQGVPFFFKQWGGRTPKSGGRCLDGQIWDQYPLIVEDGAMPLPDDLWMEAEAISGCRQVARGR